MARQPYTHTDPTPPQCPQNCHCGAPDHLPKPPCGLGGDMPQGSPTDLEVSPLLQPSFTQGFPPAFLQWMACGRYPGAPHGFHVGFPPTKVAQKFEADLRAALCWLLAGVPVDG
ncbi:hypothetical protein VTO73DRAFT_10131 [Trametes versicolor]